MPSSQSEYSLFELTAEFIHHTSQNIFLTGKAGTGKTTFLKHIKETCKKNVVIVAPTGVAAINAGGVTAHSFFQLPLGSFYPGSYHGQFRSESAITDRHHLIRNLRISNEKRDLMQSLDLVIIDEVSMLRCDLLDAIDVVLRFLRKNQQPFGGVQMLFIGDLFQLPPVVKDDEWELLKEYYASPFFFESQAFKEARPVCIELKKVYRQSDEQFIHLLNHIRNNETEEEDLEMLHRQYQPRFHPKPEDHFITLTTHNYKADDINSKELRRLSGKEFHCEASVNGEFPDRNFPVEKTLHLKAGAQIMFVRNDTEEKKYFNGKIGVIKSLNNDQEDEFIEVEFPEEKKVIRVEKAVWKNIRYSFNENENNIKEEELGSFTQYPVRLAWAVTIHKSQGLTFHRVVIDAGQAFAPGQVYVALSRCVTLEGIVLLSQIRRNVIMTDPAIVEFMNHQEEDDSLILLLEKEKQEYGVQKIKKLFDLQASIVKMNDFIIYMGERQFDEKEAFISSLHTINNEIIQLKEVSEKFLQQVDKMVSSGLNAERGKQLEDRSEKAKLYFEKELDEKVNHPLIKINRDLQQKNKVRKLLKEMKSFMKFFEHFTNRYRKEPVTMEEKFEPASSFPRRAEIPEEASEQMLQMLKQIRRQFAQEENVPPYMICHDAGLIEMSTYFPQTISDMAMIKGMGDKSLNKYGEAFLTIVQSFSRMNALGSRMDLIEAERMKKKSGKKNRPATEGDSKTQSFKLFQEGKTIEEIATLRDMAPGTIESHLAFFVKSGDIDILKVLSKEKFELISEAFKKSSQPGLGPVKNQLGEAVSYAEIRFVANALSRYQSE